MKPRRWQDAALCAQPDQDPEDWFPILNTTDGAVAAAHAKSVCRRCPVIRICLRSTLAAEKGTGLKSRSGIAAGLTPHQRYEVERGRPIRVNAELADRLFGLLPSPPRQAEAA